MAAKAVKAVKKEKAAAAALSKTPSHSELSIGKPDAVTKYDVWPYWSDADIATEKWDFSPGKTTKDKAKSPTPFAAVPSGLYEDPPSDRFVLPPGLENGNVTWKRPSAYLADKGPPVVISPDNMDTCDLVMQNTHLLHDPILSAVITELQLMFKLSLCCGKPAEAVPSKGTGTPAGRSTAKQPVSLEPPRFGVDNWRPWDHIYPRPKGSTTAQYNPSGKYAVRLFWLGHWRKVIVDDLLPVNEDNLLLLPVTPLLTELWPIILSKALLKIASLEYARFKTEFPDPHYFSVMHMLSAWLPEYPQAYDKWCIKQNKEWIWEFIQQRVPFSDEGPYQTPNSTPSLQSPESSQDSQGELAADPAMSTAADGALSPPEVKPAKNGKPTTARTPKPTDGLAAQSSVNTEKDPFMSSLGLLLKDPNKLVVAEMPWPPKEKRATSKAGRERSVETVLELLPKLGLPVGVAQRVIILATSDKGVEPPKRVDPNTFKAHFSYMGFMSDVECNALAEQMYSDQWNRAYESIQICFPVGIEPKSSPSHKAEQANGEATDLSAASCIASGPSENGSPKAPHACERKDVTGGQPGLQYKCIWITSKVFRRLFTWFKVYHRPSSFGHKQTIDDFQLLSCGNPPAAFQAPTASSNKKESKAEKASSASIGSQQQSLPVDTEAGRTKHYIYVDQPKQSVLFVGVSAYLPWQSVAGHPPLPLPSFLELMSRPQHDDYRNALPERRQLASSADVIAAELAVASSKRDVKAEAKQQRALRTVVSHFDWTSSKYTQDERGAVKEIDMSTTSVAAMSLTVPAGRQIFEIDHHQLGIASHIDLWMDEGVFQLVSEAGLWKLLSQPSARLVDAGTLLTQAVATALTDFPDEALVGQVFRDFGTKTAEGIHQQTEKRWVFFSAIRILFRLLRDTVPETLKATLKEKCDDDVIAICHEFMFMALPHFISGVSSVLEMLDDSRVNVASSPANGRDGDNEEDVIETEDKAAVKIQAVIRGHLGRKKARTFKRGRERTQEDYGKAKACATELLSSGDEFGQTCWRYLMYEEPRILKVLPFGNDERQHGIVTEFTGVIPDIMPHTWVPMFRETFIVHQVQKVAFSMECNLPNYRWKMVVINNDKPNDTREPPGQQLMDPAGGSTLLATPLPRRLEPNKNGYTFMAYGRSLKDPVVLGKYTFRILASSSPVPSPKNLSPSSDIASMASAPGSPANALPTVLSIRTIKEHYFPENKNYRVFRMVLLSQRAQTLSFNLLLSNRAAVVRLVLYDGEEVVREVIGRKGEAQINLVLLDAVPVLAAEAASIAAANAAAAALEKRSQVLAGLAEEGDGTGSKKKGDKRGKAAKSAVAKKTSKVADVKGDGAQSGSADNTSSAAGTSETPPSEQAEQAGNAESAAASTEPVSQESTMPSVSETPDVSLEDQQSGETASDTPDAFDDYSQEQTTDGFNERPLLNDRPFRAGEATFLTGARRENRRKETRYSALLKQEIDNMFQEFDEPLQRPETHQYILEAHILGNSWPLEESAWHASFNVPHPTGKNHGSLGAVQDLNPSSGKSRPQSSRVGGEERRPSAAKKKGGKKELSRAKSVMTAQAGVTGSPDAPKVPKVKITPPSGGKDKQQAQNSGGLRQQLGRRRPGAASQKLSPAVIVEQALVALQEEESQDFSHVDASKPHWTLKVVYDSSAKDDIDIRYDTTEEDRKARWMERMEREHPGRFQKGEELRDRWIRERISAPSTSVDDASAESGRYGDPLWGAPGHDTACIPEPDISPYIRRSPATETVFWTKAHEEEIRQERWSSLNPLRQDVESLESMLPYGLRAKERIKLEQRRELNDLFGGFQDMLDKYDEARDKHFVSKGYYSLKAEKPPEPAESPAPPAADKKGKAKDTKKAAGKGKKK